MKFAEWKKYPLPEAIYKKYGVDMPDPDRTMKEFLREYEKIRCLPGDGELEIRPPAPGGLRELGELTKEITVESVPLHHEEKPKQLEDSKESTDSKNQPSELPIESNPQ
jgi:hypothetical protein